MPHIPSHRETATDRINRILAGEDLTREDAVPSRRKIEDAGAPPTPSVETPAVLPSPAPVEPAPAPVGEVPTQDATDSQIMEWYKQQDFRPTVGPDAYTREGWPFDPTPTEAEIGPPTLEEYRRDVANVGPFPEERPTGERLREQFLPAIYDPVQPEQMPEFIPGPLRRSVATILTALEQGPGVLGKTYAAIATDPNYATDENILEKLASALERQEAKPGSQRMVEEGILDPTNFLGLGLGRQLLRSPGVVSVTGKQQAAGLSQLLAKEAAGEATERARTSLGAGYPIGAPFEPSLIVVDAAHPQGERLIFDNVRAMNRAGTELGQREGAIRVLSGDAPQSDVRQAASELGLAEGQTRPRVETTIRGIPRREGQTTVPPFRDPEGIEAAGPGMRQNISMHSDVNQLQSNLTKQQKQLEGIVKRRTRLSKKGNVKGARDANDEAVKKGEEIRETETALANLRESYNVVRSADEVGLTVKGVVRTEPSGIHDYPGSPGRKRVGELPLREDPVSGLPYGGGPRGKMGDLRPLPREQARNQPPQPGQLTNVEPVVDDAVDAVNAAPIGQVDEAADAAREGVRAQVTRELYDAVETSPTDIAATTYMRSGKISDFIDNTPGPTQTTGPRGGVQSTSGFEVAQDMIDEPVREVGRIGAGLSDPTRLIQAIDFGVFGRALQRGLLWPTRRTFLASMQWGNTSAMQYRQILERHGINRGFLRPTNPIRRRQKLDAAGDVLEEIGTNEVNVADDLLVHEHSRLLERFTPEERLQIVRLAKDTRLFFDDMLDVQNATRLKRGQAEIPKVQNYRPWIRNTNIWARVGLSDLPARELADPSLAPDFIKPNAAFNPRALQRVGGLEGYEKVRNIEKLALDYVETARKDVFYTNIIQNGKAHIKELRRKGVPTAADAVENWIMEAYAGKPTGLSKRLRGSVLPDPVRKGMFALRRSLTRAVFPLNWTWNTFVQTSSASLTLKNYGVTSTLQGMEYLLKPSVRKAVQEMAYSVIVKRRSGGRYAQQDVGPGVGSSAEMQRSAVDTVEGWANFLTNIIEDSLTGISVRAAYHDGVRKGFKGRELWEYASEGGSKTQSMYNIEDLPGLLRTREVAAAVPFQTFAFEVFNHVRELGIGLGRIGADKTHRNRMVMIAHWVGAMAAFNIVGDRVNNRKPWQLSSFVPFWATITAGLDPHNPWGQLLPERYASDFKKGITSFYQYGDWKKLRTWAIRYHMLGGTQINKVIQGIEAVSEGEVSDVRGRKLFDVSQDEWFKAISQGPYSTSEGREYTDKLNESKGPGYGYTGIPVPKKPFWLNDERR